MRVDGTAKPAEIYKEKYQRATNAAVIICRRGPRLHAGAALRQAPGRKSLQVRGEAQGLPGDGHAGGIAAFPLGQQGDYDFASVRLE